MWRVFSIADIYDFNHASEITNTWTKTLNDTGNYMYTQQSTVI